MAFDVERQDLARGVRAAVATVVPFALAWTLHVPELSWLALGGWLSSLADPGGTRSKHAALLAAFAVCAGGVVLLGALAQPHAILAAGFLALVAFGGSVLRAAGGVGSTFGTLVTVSCAIAISSGAAVPWHAGGLFALGSVWSALISSTVWPIWTHLPLRRALAAVFRALAAQATHVGARSLRRWQAPVRTALDAARAISLSLRARRFGESVLGSNLRALLGVAETSFFGLIALGETRRDALTAEPDVRLLELSATYIDIAEALAVPRLRNDADPNELPPAPSRAESLPDRLQGAAALVLRVARAPTRHFTESEVSPPAADEAFARLAEARRAFVGSLSLRSTYFRHAVRVACTALAATWLGRWALPTHVAWVTVTALAVLQPYPGATWTRAVERAIGTVLGCIATAGLMSFVHSPLGLAAVMFPLSVAAVYTKPRSYRWFTFFLTPVFVLFLDAGHGDFWTVVLRGFGSGLGALVALAATFVIFPSWEGSRIAETLERLQRTLRDYVDVSLESVLETRTPAWSTRLTDGRRAVGQALGEAELSLERLLSEPRRGKRGAHRAMQLVTHSRRLTASLTTMDVQRESAEPTARRADVEALRAWLDDVLEGRAAPGSAPPDGLELGESLSRVVRQGQLLAGLSKASSANVGKTAT